MCVEKFKIKVNQDALTLLERTISDGAFILVSHIAFAPAYPYHCRFFVVNLRQMSCVFSFICEQSL